jgi:hypothetical protein
MAEASKAVRAAREAVVQAVLHGAAGDPATVALTDERWREHIDLGAMLELIRTVEFDLGASVQCRWQDDGSIVIERLVPQPDL